jgi:predicted PurR-regulated permease PerM
MIMDHISAKMGNYLRGQLLLMLSIGVVIGIALAILGVPYPLLLGIWAGLMELFPYVGPVLGAVPGVFLAFTTLGMVKGLIALVIYLIVQQLENQFLAPKIMGKALGLSPVVIIFALLIGGKLFGLVGLLIAVPVAGAISVFYQEWRNGRT